MKKTIFIIVGLFIAMPGYAVALPTYYPEEIADRQMAILDVDHSNTIDATEFESAAVNKFNNTDTNGDGVLSGEEMFVVRYATRPDVLKTSKRNKDRRIGNILKHWDSNKDLQVSLEEALEYRRAEFRFVDRDESKMITREEMVAHWQRKKVEMENSRNKGSKSKE